MRYFRSIFTAICFFWSFSFADPSYKVLGIGAAAVDLLIQVDDAFFAEHHLGGKGGSQLCTSELIDKIIEASGSAPKIVPGGSCANTMRALAKLGESAAYFSHIGTDKLGEHYGEHLRQGGVVDRLAKRPDLPTPRILCLITPDGQRTFRAFDPPVHDIVLNSGHFEKVSLVHAEARQIRNGLSLQKALEYAKQAKAKISMDLSCFEIVREYKEQLLFLLSEYVNIVFCNEDELVELVGLSGFEGCRKLAQICPIAVVTLGAKGCLIGHGEEIYSIPTFPAEVIDTTGAGDLFAAGFLYGYLQDFSLLDCAKVGHLLGSSVVEVIGAELPQQKWEEIRARVMHYSENSSQNSGGLL
ncbi:MAG: adenosine kinase [Verrucomicrobia bacterium]|nr:adenosine kinase [Verrucomicrobiota bacterium]